MLQHVLGEGASLLQRSGEVSGALHRADGAQFGEASLVVLAALRLECGQRLLPMPLGDAVRCAVRRPCFVQRGAEQLGVVGVAAAGAGDALDDGAGNVRHHVVWHRAALGKGREHGHDGVGVGNRPERMLSVPAGALGEGDAHVRKAIRQIRRSGKGEAKRRAPHAAVLIGVEQLLPGVFAERVRLVEHQQKPVAARQALLHRRIERNPCRSGLGGEPRRGAPPLRFEQRVDADHALFGRRIAGRAGEALGFHHGLREVGAGLGGAQHHDMDAGLPSGVFQEPEESRLALPTDAVQAQEALVALAGLNALDQPLQDRHLRCPAS